MGFLPRDSSQFCITSRDAHRVTEEDGRSRKVDALTRKLTERRDERSVTGLGGTPQKRSGRGVGASEP
jgi:ribosomal protein L44E